LARYIEDLAVSGLTSNPTILGHAMSGGSDYDESITRMAKDGVADAQDLVYAVALEDLSEAARLFRPIWEQTAGVDGYVSLEVPPGLAYDAPGTLAFARRLHDEAGLENLLVKIPGTAPGLSAMTDAIAAGVGINVTLLFSDAQYLQTADAYLRALERRQGAGLSLEVPSVASIFVSRWDKAADPLLPEELHGRLGIAVVQKVCASYRSLLATDRWRALAEAGARPQRVLWASTSTKDPAFPDTYYLGRLAAPDTVDTVPEATLLAFADHGELGDMLEPDYAQPRRPLPGSPARGSTWTRWQSRSNDMGPRPSRLTGRRCSKRSMPRPCASAPSTEARPARGELQMTGTPTFVIAAGTVALGRAGLCGA
jgi:transaldolase